jgi:hypothetical protein
VVADTGATPLKRWRDHSPRSCDPAVDTMTQQPCYGRNTICVFQSSEFRASRDGKQSADRDAHRRDIERIAAQFILRTTLNLALPLIIRSYATCASSSGKISFLERMP